MTSRAATAGASPNDTEADHANSAASRKNCPFAAFGIQMLPYTMVTPTATSENITPSMMPVVIVERRRIRFASDIRGPPAPRVAPARSLHQLVDRNHLRVP